MWDILAWIIVGGLAGWLASVLVRGRGMGMLMNIVIGIIGAFIGGLIVELFSGTGFTGFNLWSFFVAFIGAVALLLVVRLVTGARGRTV